MKTLWDLPTLRTPGTAPPRAERAYRLLPFRFVDLDATRVLLSNFAGDYAVISRPVLEAFVAGRLDPDSEEFRMLQGRHFAMGGASTVGLDLLALRQRSRWQSLAELTGLFLFVVTLRCEHSCGYCQVSRRTSDTHGFDLPAPLADRAVDLAFESPNPALKIEFQGGEPLLAFDIIRRIVLRCEERNRSEEQHGRGRDLQFVIASNLACLDDEILDFCADHGVRFSTSLDGPAALHNRNRPRPGGNSHELTERGIERIRARLGPEGVSALMTTTRHCLREPESIVDEYVRLGFDSIFLRPVSPFGFAGRSRRPPVSEWLAFFDAALARILEWNRRGISLREEYSTILLQKILTDRPTGYVDLQSPAGLGIGALAFNYDGQVYASDEGRMLAENGDQSLRLGRVDTHRFEELIGQPRLARLLSTTLTESAPMCADCGFQPYCGADPAHHLATCGDPVGRKPESDFCRRQMGLLRRLFSILEGRGEEARLLRAWVR